MEIVNLTPHEIKVVGDEENVHTFAPSGQTTRIHVIRYKFGYAGDIPLYKSELGQVEGLPEQKEGVYLIVSTLIRTSFPARKDLLSPGELIRDAKGQPTGCRGFDRN